MHKKTTNEQESAGADVGREKCVTVKRDFVSFLLGAYIFTPGSAWRRNQILDAPIRARSAYDGG